MIQPEEGKDQAHLKLLGLCLSLPSAGFKEEDHNWPSSFLTKALVPCLDVARVRATCIVIEMDRGWGDNM